MTPLPRALAAGLLLAAIGTVAHAQDGLPLALEQMLDIEREFSVRSAEDGWQAAYRAFLAAGAGGFEPGAGVVNEQLRSTAESEEDARRLTWEPRLGDSAASGEFGYLTGPMRTTGDAAATQHGAYLHVWKRQRSGRFRAVLAVSTPTPGPPAFADGFTRAATANRFTEYDESTPPLGTADGLLNAALRDDPARAYRGRLTVDARFHRPNRAPLVGEDAIARWLDGQPAFSVADLRYAEAARSGDLGYTWGTYAQPQRDGSTRRGVYVRVWVRQRDGQWYVALDVLEDR